ncbi:hypothetical protein HII36_39550 [Nonomuraea sp. NN258]|uniref:hypothetical protein n=1 Tax=Nonomuraea antri TaxID=2730852 RepID=UPI00156A3B7F|nr:hypothetical protein [Nonomuraea antri]NRQ37883.1 hypothetical protein [Nonomuraea antri]
MTRGGLVELGLIVAFVMGFAVIGAPFLAHTIVGSSFAGLVVLHFWQRRGRGTTKNGLLTPALHLSLVVVLVSGAFQLAGSQPARWWHGGLSWLLTLALALHLWNHRRPLRFRLKSLRGNGRQPPRRPRGDRHGE